MQRDTWPPMPPSQTTLIRLYQMGMTFPPPLSPGPVTGNCGDKSSRESVGQAGQPTGYVDTGEMSRQRMEWDRDPHTLSLLTYSMLHKWWECLGAGTVDVPESLPFPRAVHRFHRPSTPCQGCGSHAHTLGDIFVLFHTLSRFLPKPHGSTWTVAGSG